jgi:hypothetical protein
MPADGQKQESQKARQSSQCHDLKLSVATRR